MKLNGITTDGLKERLIATTLTLGYARMVAAARTARTIEDADAAASLMLAVIVECGTEADAMLRALAENDFKDVDITPSTRQGAALAVATAGESVEKTAEVLRRTLHGATIQIAATDPLGQPVPLRRVPGEPRGPLN